MCEFCEKGKKIVQLSLIGARAKVVQGDTLANPNVKEKECIFYTPMWKGLL